MVKLLNEEGPPFVERAQGVVGGLEFGNVGGSNKVEQELNG